MSNKTERVKVQLPENVRQQIRVWWPNDKAHAAKQAYCYFLSFWKVFERDHNQVVDVGLSSGMLVERMKDNTADEFITAYEEQILNGRS